MKSVKCRECGFVGWADAEFCKKCGASVAAAPAASSPDYAATLSPASEGDITPDGQTIYYSPRVNPFPEDVRTGWAVTSLVLGILNFLFLGITVVSTVVGIIISVAALKKIKRNPFEHGGKGMAVAGLVMNLVSVAVLIPIAMIAAIAIPNLLAARAAANEGAAINSLRKIHTAEETYQATRGGGKYGTLSDLESMNLITSDLASGTKYGYRFSVDLSTKDIDGAPGFMVLGTPVNYPSTGRRSFLIDESGVIRGEDDHGLEASRSAPPLRVDSDYSNMRRPNRRSLQSDEE